MEEAFVSAAEAVKETICGDTKIEAAVEKQIELSGNDFESLLYGFIEEFLYLLDAEGFLPAEVRSIEIGNGRLVARIAGDTAGQYKVSNSVKAVTYNEMAVTAGEDGWVAEFVLDV
jgi:SHS2 domain-containing protein